MGCGRVGAGLARTLEDEGHKVSVIDQDREAFRRLGPDFKGNTVTGVGFDRDILIEAGIESCDAFAAVSNGDNSNILAARVARETYNVKNVVARIYDPARAEIYQRLGIPTVATVAWTQDQIYRRLTPSGAKSEWRDQTGRISICEVFPNEGWIGKPISLIDEQTTGRVAIITRLGEATLPSENTVLQEGDVLHILIKDSEIDDVVSKLAKAPE
jgi:trk system potassium uptake protein